MKQYLCSYERRNKSSFYLYLSLGQRRSSRRFLRGRWGMLLVKRGGVVTVLELPREFCEQSAWITLGGYYFLTPLQNAYWSI
ncbi:hypothetical protein phiLo_67 [Thermus phage phiLo]|nr:hypothetical protein phiLo_67 [Thermus phage phiLo]